jgi:hypothetical protein
MVMNTTLARSIRRGFSTVVLAAALSELVLGQPQGSLQGRELQLTNDSGSGLESFISGLLGGGNSGAGIERVVVMEDGPGHLTVAITHSGLTGARIAGEIRDRGRERIRAIAPARADADSASGETRLSFELRPESAGASEIHSGYLRLSISQPSRPIPTTTTYLLPKTWSGGGSGGTGGGGQSGGMVRISPKPVGAAAKLGSRPDYENPPKPPLKPRPQILVRPAAAGAAITGGGRMKPATGAMIATAPARGGVATAPPAPGSGAAAMPAPTGRGGQNNPTITAKTAAVQSRLPAQKSKDMLGIQGFKYGVREQDQKLGAQGPGDAAIDLLEGLAADDVGLSGDEILMVAPIVYQDQNPASGIFYYVPRGYRTEWTAETGYGLRMLYGASKGAEAGEVALAARLDAGIDLRESRLASDLLAAYVQRHTDVKFTALRPLPIDQVEVSLASGLQQYSIPPEKIATVAISDILGQIEISCVTDAISKESLQLALTEDIGLSGAVKFTPSGGKLAAQQIPLRLRLADADSFGTLTWRRDEQLHNRTLYPLTLTYLHALVIDPRTNTPFVYSWDLGSAQVAPGGRVEWDPARVPAWIDRDAKRMWVQYRPVAKCRPCDERVIAEVTGGVVSVTTSQLVFRTITPLADTGAYELTVHVRSRFFDPQGQQSQQKSIVLGADGEDFPIGPLYVGESQQGTIAEYAIDVAMKDGSVHKAKRWLRADGLRVLIGSTQIRESTGINPSENKGEPK